MSESWPNLLRAFDPKGCCSGYVRAGGPTPENPQGTCLSSQTFSQDAFSDYSQSSLRESIAEAWVLTQTL